MVFLSAAAEEKVKAADAALAVELANIHELQGKYQQLLRERALGQTLSDVASHRQDMGVRAEGTRPDGFGQKVQQDTPAVPGSGYERHGSNATGALTFFDPSVRSTCWVLAGTVI